MRLSSADEYSQFVTKTADILQQRIDNAMAAPQSQSQSSQSRPQSQTQPHSSQWHANTNVSFPQFPSIASFLSVADICSLQSINCAAFVQLRDFRHRAQPPQQPRPTKTNKAHHDERINLNNRTEMLLHRCFMKNMLVKPHRFRAFAAQFLQTATTRKWLTLQLFKAFYELNVDIALVRELNLVIAHLITQQQQPQQTPPPAYHVQQQRRPLHMHVHAPHSLSMSLDAIPSHLIGAFASFLPQHDYMRFQTLNRWLYISCNSPNQLRTLEVAPQMRPQLQMQLCARNIPFDRFPSIRQIKVPAADLESESCTMIALQTTDDMVQHLLHGNREIRDITYQFVRHKMATLAAKTSGRNVAEYHCMLVRLIRTGVPKMQNLLLGETAISMAEHSNAAFPPDLKNYTERVPKLHRFLTIVLSVAHEPVVVEELQQVQHWRQLVESLQALEDGAVSAMCAKNDDKLLLLEIAKRCLEHGDYGYRITPQTLPLIQLLTTHFLVSTRSLYVSAHMQRVVLLTFEMLQKFAAAIEQETDERQNWIRHQLVDTYWFHWALTDIVTPHAVYNSNKAAHCILTFVENIMPRFACLRARNVRAKLVRQVCKKWSTFDGQQIAFHPRITVFQLLKVLLHSEHDHIVFHAYCRPLLQRWVSNFLFTDVLDGDQGAGGDTQIETYAVALDFFQSQVDAAIKFERLRSREMVHICGVFMDAIYALFLWYVNNGDQDAANSHSKWAEIYHQALRLLRSIFVLRKCVDAPTQRSYGCSDEFLRKFLYCISRTEITLLPSHAQCYMLSEQSTEMEKKTIAYIAEIIDDGSERDFAGWNGDRPCLLGFTGHKERANIVPLLDVFYAECCGGDVRECLGMLDAESATQFRDHFVCNWMLHLMGYKQPQTVYAHTRHIMRGIVEVSNSEMLRTILSHVLFCLFMASDAFHVRVFADELNLSGLRLLTESVCQSQQGDEESEDMGVHVLSRLNTTVLAKVIPMRLRQCVQRITDSLTSNGEHTACMDMECTPFIGYCHQVLTMQKDSEHEVDKQWWKRLRVDIDQVIELELNRRKKQKQSTNRYDSHLFSVEPYRGAWLKHMIGIKSILNEYN